MAAFFCGRELALHAGFLCGFFFLAYGQGTSKPGDCTPDALFKCYDMYRLELKGAQALADEGTYQEELNKKCSLIKDKLPCHKEIASCPEMSRLNFSSHERGYQAVRDIICDKQALKDSYVAGSCEDGQKLIDCLVEWTFRHYDDDPPHDENVRLCRKVVQCHAVKDSSRLALRQGVILTAALRSGAEFAKPFVRAQKPKHNAELPAAFDTQLFSAVLPLRRLRGSLACYEETFVASSCPVPLEFAKPAYARTQEALVKLVGCEEPNGSTQSSSAPQGLLLAMVALAFVRWTTS